MRGNKYLVVVAHPVHGRIQRFHVPHGMLHAAFGLVALALIVTIGLGANYFREASENARLVAENNALQEEYDSLLLTVEERDKQLESLSNLAFQISIAYGFRRDSSDADTAYGGELVPAYHASLNQYDFIQGALGGLSSGPPLDSLLENTTPSIWPTKGHITSSYGKRLDPFNGKGAFHPGIDISAPYGTPVIATADGYVISADWDGGLGHCVKLIHGRNGFRTVYGHLKEYFVRRASRYDAGRSSGSWAVPDGRLESTSTTKCTTGD